MPVYRDIFHASQVLTRRRLLCRKTRSRRLSSGAAAHQSPLSLPSTSLPTSSSTLSLQSSSSFLSSHLSSSSSSLGLSAAPSATPPAAPETHAVMSREAFSWILKDLKSQVMSLVVEFLFLLDGGLLSNAAHDANLRHSSSSHTSSGHASQESSSALLPANQTVLGGRDIGQINHKARGGGYGGKAGSRMDGGEDGGAGSSASRIEVATREVRS